jgi:tetratricopeptide (TPR) repeat protein
MHILRWLLKHPIMLAWLLALIAILLNFSMGGRDSLEQAQEASAEHGQAVSQAPAAQEQTEAKPQEQAAQAGGQDVVVAPASEPQAAVAETQPELAAVVPPSAPVEAVQQQTEPAVPAAVAPVDTTAAQQPAPEASAAPASAEDLLQAAREAYWSNELDSAAGFYQSLVKKVPDSVEYKGELANVYWKQGNARQAAELFTEIAPKLAAAGRATEALNMKLYVDMVDPELAKKIDAALGK